ncbi:MULTISPECIES: P27 family phage terminase small subunit [unclassified Leisingera]|uniref:P27 family phage terminase small subunit n=1 Tax=unclassified Leisingera TaxID=2614906 RepID=UPI0003052467|nr:MULTISPECIES: P27 family phage terminase small subunit [unclassified Leisingera]KIC19629.1 hypothetical protein RA21_03810 [Leisingera sp. ANG-DT]KIC30061.1 hypothetical protein RA24_03730 [Leisingera sp. ANG-M6]KIC54491.1 hypothetical protein RA22_07595 [Leisingera sp. ANG-S]KID10688.1 hypothetical protein GC1_03160 [Leisingera sp. ANG1]
MKGAKPSLDNVIPMKGDAPFHVPDAPDFMSSEGREVWERLAPVVAQKGRLEPHHVDLFAAYCEACADFIRFTGDIAMMGSYFETTGRHGKQEKRRVVWSQRNDALATMQRISSLFGMSPVDEKRLGAGGQGDLLADLERMLSGNASA